MMDELNTNVQKIVNSIGKGAAKRYLLDLKMSKQKDLGNYRTSLSSDKYWKAETTKEIKSIDKLMKSLK